MGEWRALRIDGSSESAFDESLARLDEELSYVRRHMLALALVDIARTGQWITDQAGDEIDQARANEAFRLQLDGLTYDDVIALADQTGPTIYQQYYAGRRALDFSQDPFGLSTQPEPVFDNFGNGPSPNAWTLGNPLAPEGQ